MKHSEILQLALDEYLAQSAAEEKEKTEYICYAVSRAVDELPAEANTNKEELIEHIMNCLHPTATVTDWLMLNNYVGLYPDEFDRDQIQLYRKLWMLHLIEEYKAQGL